MKLPEYLARDVNKHLLIRRGWNRVLDLLAPCECDLCGLPSHRAIDLCLPCEGELPWLLDACSQCAIPLAGDGPLCGKCISEPPAFDRCTAALAYTEPVSSWIHAGKYRGDFSRLAILAELMSRPLAAALEWQPPPALLLPMPLHWRRQWWRGYNQAEVLADLLARQPRLLPYRLHVEHTLCRRVLATTPQQGLDAKLRRRNLRNAFRCDRPLEGAAVAIIDDVVTTGASAGELARTLKAAGAGSVSVWCCARTPADCAMTATLSDTTAP